MMRFISFSSGSCGNCSLLLGPQSGILIDAGVSFRRVKKELEYVGLGLQDISAILVTHDHGDHIRSLGSFCKRLAVPVWTTPLLHGALARHPFTSEWIGACRQNLERSVWNPVTPDFDVQYFEVPHDATQCVGYAIRCGEELFVLMTDLGHVPADAFKWGSMATTLVIESNFDVDMLLGGSYPQELKNRISHGAGHLSNDVCAQTVTRLLHSGLKHVFLCHLSGNNNTPQLAYDCTAAALMEVGVTPGEAGLRVLRRGESSPLLSL
jgi:phosphoribosyl 1,2-cyclic phosphodiesterase